MPDDVVDRLKVLAHQHQVSLSDLLRPIIGTLAVDGHLPGVTYTVERAQGVEPSSETGNVGMGLTGSTIVADTDGAGIEACNQPTVVVKHTTDVKPEFAEHRGKVSRSERRRLKFGHLE